MPDDVTPLPLDLWFERVDLIARGALGNIENALRHACHLLQLVPDPLSQCVNWKVDEYRMERLLDAQNFDSAARHLLGRTSGLSVATVSGDTFRATLTCAFSKQEFIGHGGSEAAAILAASTACLIGIRVALYGPDNRVSHRATRH